MPGQQSQTSPSTSTETATTPLPTAPAAPSTSPGSQSPVESGVNDGGSGQAIPQGRPSASTVGDLALTGLAPLALVVAGLVSLAAGILLLRGRKRTQP